MTTHQGSSDRTGSELVLTEAAEAANVTRFATERAEEEAAQNILLITADLTPDEAFTHLRKAFDTKPWNIGCISIGETTRSAAADTPETPDQLPSKAPATPCLVTTVAGDDLAGLTNLVDLYLRDWSDNDASTRICFAGLASVLEQSELYEVFRFVHVLTHQIRTADAVAEFYFDTRDYSQQPIGTLRTLFDSVIDEREQDDQREATSDAGLPAILEDGRERRILKRLLKSDGPVAVEVLAEWVAHREATTTGHVVEQAMIDEVHTELHHIHIPALVEAGLVVTNEDHDLVETTHRADQLDPELLDE